MSASGNADDEIDWFKAVQVRVSHKTLSAEARIQNICPSTAYSFTDATLQSNYVHQ